MTSVYTLTSASCKKNLLHPFLLALRTDLAADVAKLGVYCGDAGAPKQLSTASAVRFQIWYAHPISLDCHQLYIVIVANGCGCTQGHFGLSRESPWLARRIKLKTYASSSLP